MATTCDDDAAGTKGAPPATDPLFADTAAVGRPHDVKDEVIAVFVTLKGGTPGDERKTDPKKHVMDNLRRNAIMRLLRRARHGTGRDSLRVARGRLPQGRANSPRVVPAEAYVGKFLATFKEFPPSQQVGSFSLDQVLEKLQQGGDIN